MEEWKDNLICVREADNVLLKTGVHGVQGQDGQQCTHTAELNCTINLTVDIQKSRGHDRAHKLKLTNILLSACPLAL